MDLDVTFIIDFFDWIWTFLSVDLYDFVKDGAVWVITKITIAWFEFKIFMLELAWNIAQGLLYELNLSSALDYAWSSADAEVRQMLVYFRVPEAFNIILSAGATRYVMRFMGMA